MLCALGEFLPTGCFARCIGKAVGACAQLFNVETLKRSCKGQNLADFGFGKRNIVADKVIAAMAGQTFQAPSGYVLTMDPKNHHLHKPVLIGEIKADGQFDVVWQTKGPIKAQPWSPFIEGNDKKKDEPEKK